MTFVYKGMSYHGLESTAFPRPHAGLFLKKDHCIIKPFVSLSWELYGCPLGIPIPNGQLQHALQKIQIHRGNEKYIQADQTHSIIPTVFPWFVFVGRNGN